MSKKIIGILFLQLLFLSTWAQHKHKIMVIAHEGAKGAMPENTIEGMKKALDLGADALQTEVVITKDGKVILSHEPFFNHQISLNQIGKPFSIADENNYNIFKMNYLEVKKFDIGSKVNPDYPGQQKFKAHKPLLSDFLDEIEAYIKEKNLNKKMQYFIEIKTIPNGEGKYHPGYEEFVDIVMDVINAKKLANRVIMVSLEPKVLKYMHDYYEKLKVGYMVENKTNYTENIQLLGFYPEYYIPYYPLVGVSLVDACHKDRVKIAPWVVNSSKMIGNLADWKADAFITDYPNLYDIAFPTEEKGQVIKNERTKESKAERKLRKQQEREQRKAESTEMEEN